MDIENMKAVWQSHDQTLTKSVAINLRCLSGLQAQKVNSNLSPLLWKRLIETVLHGIVLLLLVLFLYRHYARLPYAVSALTLLAFYSMLFANSFRQIHIIRHIDYSQDVVSIQSALATLQTHSLNFMRLLLLFMPAVFAYPMVVSKVIQDFDLTWLRFMDIQSQYAGNWWTVQAIATVIWTPVCIWLYRTVSYKNSDVPWVKQVIEKAVGRRVAGVMAYMKELDALKHEDGAPV